MDEKNSRRQATPAELWSRREVIGRGAALGMVVTVAAAGTATRDSALAAAAPKAAALAPNETAVLEAIVARLIPADANGPSGVDAGAAAYVEKSLTGGLAGGLAALAGFYSANLAAVDAYAQSAYGAGFTALTPDKQDAVLMDMEAGKATGFVPTSTAFFQAVHEHTLQGMFSDPVYGGNRNFAGWDLLGYPGVKMPVSPHDQKLDVAVERAHQSTYANGQYPKARREAVA